MNIKKIISQVLLLVLLVSIVSIDTHATVPSKVSGINNELLDGGVKLTWYKLSDATSYIIKRSGTRTGNYTIIADNILENTYEDKGLENAKTYYYKIISKNDDGIGQESDIVEVTPSKSNYLWVEIHGFDSRIKNLEIYDIDGNNILYNKASFRDDTCRREPNNWIRDLKGDNGFEFNSSWSSYYTNDSIHPAVIGLKLKPHKGIKKISFSGCSIKATFYAGINSSKYQAEKFGEIIFEKGKNTKYELFRSGLQAKGQNKKVSLSWNHLENIKNCRIKRAESINGPFTLIADNINKDNYIDTMVENRKTYYYKLEAENYLGDTLDLGTAYAKTTKVRYIIMEIICSESENRINEMHFLDKDNNIINYEFVQYASYGTPISYNPETRTNKNIMRGYSNYKPLYDNDMESYKDFRLGSDKWGRYVFKTDNNIEISKINLWTGKGYTPKKITFFTSLSYDFKNNLVLRRVDDLSFYTEKELLDLNELTKYEFTQTSPNTPQGINAISQDTRVNIKWNKVDNADSYKIKRSTSPSGPYTVIQEDIVDLQYTDTGVINGTEYYYVVSAVNKGGESNNSLEASVIPSAKLPQAPTELTAKSQQNGINLSWNPIYNASSYTIKRSQTAGGSYETILENTTDTSFSDSGLTFGTTYYYVITANNTIGISNNSEEVQGTPGQVLPEKPINIITKVKENNVYLTWDTANNAVSYNVMRSEAEDGTYNIIENVKGISYKDVTAESDKTYFYKIIAVNEQGESETSEQVRVVVKDNIEQKILLSLTMKNGSTKEYVITHSQLVKFMSWYQDNTVKKGLPYFTLIAKNRYGAYKSSKKYILFDSIMAIDVKEVQSN